MTSFQILDIKQFMAQLLLQDTFDHFYLTEASITTFSTFLIDGHLRKDYYSIEEQENTCLTDQPYSFWAQIRPFCLEVIKGKKTPLNFKFVFQLSTENTEKLLLQAKLPLSPSDINGLYLNLRFDGQHLTCITGTSLHIFTLDKTLEQLWDDMVQRFFRSKKIPFAS